ncbi:MAG: mechanosensitive ion channel family protein [Halapricum sp.]
MNRYRVFASQVDVLYEQYHAWLLKSGVFVAVFLGVYAVGRFLVLPSLRTAVERRNENNPTLIGAIDLYVRVVFAVVAFPIAITAAGLGNYLSGSAIVVAALTLAIGVAGQDVISNLVSGVFLVVDGNFNVGDYINWKDRGGTVVRIGLRTTRIRTPKNEIVTVPNNDLSTNPVTHPFDGVRYRVDEPIFVAYDEDLARATEILREAAVEDPRILSSPAPVVHVESLGENAVELMIRFWVVDPAETDILATRTAFAARAKDRLAAAGVTVAPASQQAVSGSLTVEHTPTSE